MNRSLKITSRYMVACAAAALITLTAPPLAPSLADSLPQQWAHWQFYRSVDLPPYDSPRLADIIVPRGLYSHAGNSLQDIRVIDDQGAEVAFSLFTRNGFSRYVPVASKRLET